MENRLKTRPPAASLAGASAPRRVGEAARGRLDLGPPVAVIDIGSNSVRLIIYEALTRSPTPLFNEKVLAGLGREVHSTGLLPADAVDKALGAIARFRALCDTVGVANLWGLATAACRDARNGRAFIAEAERIGVPAFKAMVESRAALRNRIYRDTGMRIEVTASDLPSARASVEHGFIHGSPGRVTEALAEIDKLGIGGVIATFRLGPMPHELAVNSLKLFMGRVAPEFRRPSAVRATQ